VESGKKEIEWIREYGTLDALNELWSKIKALEANGLPLGRAFEYMVLRAFELDAENRAIVEYPYTVSLFDEQVVEQIDGFIGIPSSGIYAMAESKDQLENVSITPIYKLRGQLARRPSNLIGCFFSKSDYTHPAKLLSHFLFPQTILLWSRKDIDFCFENAYFVDAMETKYRFALKEGITNLDLKLHFESTRT
jgi:hypothetical protein